eukprot:TRINITY_DN2281_c7_g1_i1.p1 TRINITY_DN2281_c7_g1~~TRINITY_DN2281_c7_g1_i1.p1  ORF type:complete len:598 (+),score=122.54 TRINITY_DN2281_c7_g1_i1:94-1887(+)
MAAAAASGKRDAVAQVVALGHMLKAGTVTAEEFRTIKTRIMRTLPQGAAGGEQAVWGGYNGGAGGNCRQQQQQQQQGQCRAQDMRDALLLRRLGVMDSDSFARLSGAVGGCPAPGPGRYTAAEQSADVDSLRNAGVLGRNCARRAEQGAAHGLNPAELSRAQPPAAAPVQRADAATVWRPASPQGAAAAAASPPQHTPLRPPAEGDDEETASAPPFSPWNWTKTATAAARMSRHNTATELNVPQYVELSPAGSPAGSPVRPLSSLPQSSPPQSPKRERRPAPRLYEMPLALDVACPSRMAGSFTLAQTASGGPRLVNGWPLWRSGHGMWLYSTPRGFWRITDAEEDFPLGKGYIISIQPHHGASPDAMRQWRKAGKDMQGITVTAAGVGSVRVPDGQKATAVIEATVFADHADAVVAEWFAETQGLVAVEDWLEGRLGADPSSPWSPRTKSWARERLSRPNTAAQSNAPDVVELSPRSPGSAQQPSPRGAASHQGQMSEVAARMANLRHELQSGQISQDEYARRMRQNIGLPCVAEQAIVEVTGLQRRPELNGTRGIVLRRNKAKPDRWVVDLGHHGEVSIATANLKAVSYADYGKD